MSKRLRSTLLISLFLISPASASVLEAFPPSQRSDCPTISVSCPDDTLDNDKPIKFTLNITGGKSEQQISYCWRVSQGKIKSGQGTATIEVEATGADRERLTATVDVGGLDEKCSHLASCTINIR